MATIPDQIKVSGDKHMLDTKLLESRTHVITLLLIKKKRMAHRQHSTISLRIKKWDLQVTFPVVTRYIRTM